MRRIFDGFDCSSIKIAHELGLKRCESVLFLSGVNILKQRVVFFSMRRPIKKKQIVIDHFLIIFNCRSFW